MLKSRNIITISLCMMLFFITFNFVFAKDPAWPLEKNEIENLIDIMRKNPLTKANLDLYYEAIYNSRSDYARQTGAVVLVKQAILKQQLDYWFKSVPYQISKKLITTIIKIAPMVVGGVDVATIIKMIEKLTVDQATDYAINWFLQNEIKVGAGIAKYSYYSYLKNSQTISIPHLIIFKPFYGGGGEIIAEFYSYTPVEPPMNRGGLASNKDHPNSTPWPWDIWLQNEKTRNNDGKLEPFIVRIQGDVKKNEFNNFVWDKTYREPTVEVEFNKLVPQISVNDLAWQGGIAMKLEFINQKIIQPITQTLGEKLTALAEKVNKAVEIAGDMVEKIRNKLGNNNNTSQMEGNPPIVEVEPLLLPTLPIANVIQQLPKPKAEQEGNPPVDLGRLIEQFDEVSEQAEILFIKSQPAPVDNSKIQYPILNYSGIDFVLTSIDYDYQQTKKETEKVKQQMEKIVEDIDETPENPLPEPTAITQTNPPVFRGILLNPEPEPIIFCNQPEYPNPNKNQVIFNEIAWMGTTESANNEWIELKNISGQDININKWQVIDQKNQIEISLPSINLPNNAFILFERTDDTSVPSVTADIIYTGALNNSNEALYLFNSTCQLQDHTSAGVKWPKGNSTNKKTMERTNDLAWQDSQEVNGTPKAENSGQEEPEPEPNDQLPATTTEPLHQSSPNGEHDAGQAEPDPEPEDPQPEPDPEPETPPTPPTKPKLFITNLQTQTKEFVSIYNPTDEATDLNNLFLVYYSTGKNWHEPSRVWQLPDNKQINSQDYYTIGIYSTASEFVDWQVKSKEQKLYQVGQLSNMAGALGIFFCDPNDKTISEAQDCKIDLVGWGGSTIKEDRSTLAPPRNEPLVRRKNLAGNYIDTNNNYFDFEPVGSGSGGSSTGNPPTTTTTPATTTDPNLPPPIPIPDPITNLMATASANREAITLFWQAPANAQKYILKYNNQTVELPTTVSQNQFELHIIYNLNSSQEYAFTIQYTNASSTESAISNIAKATPLPGFQDNNDGTITDLYTGLMWPKNASSSLTNYGQPLARYEASTTISDFNATSSLAGYSDWHLPNYRELASLVDYNKNGPTISGPFENIQANKYWASNKKKVNQFGPTARYKSWYVNFATGDVKTETYNYNLSSELYILPVRGTSQVICPSRVQPDDPLSLGYWTDPCTNQVWSDAIPSSTGGPWQYSIIKADIYQAGGFDDWRLPTVRELINISSRMSAGYHSIFWSLTPNYFVQDKTWIVDLKVVPGTTYNNTHNVNYFIRLIRDN